jgi:hypothetical protein
MPERPGSPDTTTDASSHPPDERLLAYLDDRLDAADAEVVGHHLETCERCLARLDTLAPGPALDRRDDGEVPSFDPRAMRRAVRRTLWRTAVNAALLLVAGAIVLQLIGALVVHPLFVSRGDRVSEHVAATIDLAVMTTPGAEVREYRSNIGWVRRTTEAEAERVVGGRSVPLGGYATRLGPLAMTSDPDNRVFAYGPILSDPADDDGAVSFEPDRLPEGTAVTAELWFGEPVTTATVDELATDEVALLWVGFDVTGVGAPDDSGEHGNGPTERLGYSACAELPPFIDEVGGGGFGGTGAFRRFPATVGGGAEHALTQLRRATANLAEIGWLEQEPVDSGPLADLDAVQQRLDDPQVRSVVVTGPTPEVAALHDELGAMHADLLEVDFDRGAPEPCG